VVLAAFRVVEATVEAAVQGESLQQTAVLLIVCPEIIVEVSAEMATEV
jgi:hypothetical protein